jgi:hypothetical protein
MSLSVRRWACAPISKNGARSFSKPYWRRTRDSRLLVGSLFADRGAPHEPEHWTYGVLAPRSGRVLRHDQCALCGLTIHSTDAASRRGLTLIGDSGNGRDHQHPSLDAVIGVSGGEASRPMRGRRVDAGGATHRRDQSACHVSHRPTGIADQGWLRRAASRGRVLGEPRGMATSVRRWKRPTAHAKKSATSRGVVLRRRC